MRTENIKLLNWFMDFAYLDLDRIGGSEIITKAIEVQEILENGLWYSDIFSETLGLAKFRISTDSNLRNNLNNLKKVQQAFLKSFEATMEAIKKMHKSSSAEWVKEEDLKDYIPVEKQLNTDISIDVSIIPVTEHREVAGTFYYKWDEAWPQESFFSVRSKVGVWSGEMLTLIFYRVLNGVPIGFFKECEECNNWFLHTTKRERIYCSNRCAARKANRDRRTRDKEREEEKYKVELKSNAKRARTSYEREGHKKNPRAKIARNPHKYK